MVTPTAHTTPKTTRLTKAARTALAKRKLARFKRILRQHLPDLQARYHVAALGIFGSFVRAEPRVRSDLDILVDFRVYPSSISTFVDMEEELTALLGIKVDLVPKDGLKPYIGQRILSEVVWLDANGKASKPKTKSRANRVPPMTPKREYLDFLNDIIQNMEQAQRFVTNRTFDEFAADELVFHALSKVIENMGEAAKHIPDDVRARYPQINWQDMAAMRNRLAHGYFEIKAHILWETATESIPQALPLVTAARASELERRAQPPKKENGKQKNGEH